MCGRQGLRRVLRRDDDRRYGSVQGQCVQILTWMMPEDCYGVPKELLFSSRPRT